MTKRDKQEMQLTLSHIRIGVESAQGHLFENRLIRAYRILERVAEHTDVLKKLLEKK